MDPVIVATPEAPASQADVDIATIEAARDIELATINAESNETQTEAVLDAQANAEDEDLIWLRGELATLQERCETNAAELLNQRGEMISLRTEHNSMLERLTQAEATQAGLLLLTPPPNSEQGQQPPETESGGEDGPRENPGEQPPPADPAEETPPAPANRRKRRFLQ